MAKTELPDVSAFSDEQWEELQKKREYSKQKEQIDKWKGKVWVGEEVTVRVSTLRRKVEEFKKMLEKNSSATISGIVQAIYVDGFDISYSGKDIKVGWSDSIEV
jgi:hypothetical protein